MHNLFKSKFAIAVLIIAALQVLTMALQVVNFAGPDIALEVLLVFGNIVLSIVAVFLFVASLFKKQWVLGLLLIVSTVCAGNPYALNRWSDWYARTFHPDAYRENIINNVLNSEGKVRDYDDPTRLPSYLSHSNPVVDAGIWFNYLLYVTLVDGTKLSLFGAAPYTPLATKGESNADRFLKYAKTSLIGKDVQFYLPDREDFMNGEYYPSITDDSPVPKLGYGYGLVPVLLCDGRHLVNIDYMYVSEVRTEQDAASNAATRMKLEAYQSKLCIK